MPDERDQNSATIARKKASERRKAPLLPPRVLKRVLAAPASRRRGVINIGRAEIKSSRAGRRRARV